MTRPASDFKSHRRTFGRVSGSTDVDRRGWMGGIDSSRLHLDAKNATALEVKHRQLRGLEVGERAEQAEIAALRQQADNLDFAQESDVASPHRVRLGVGSDAF